MAYNVPIVDFVGPLSAIGANFGKARLGDKISSVMADFGGDYEQAAQKLMQMGLVDEATKLFTAGQLAKYRDVQGQVALDKAQPSVKDQIAQQWFQNNGGGAPQQPSYLGPTVDSAVAAEEAESQGATGLPGTAYAKPPSGVDKYRTAPSFITKEYAPSGTAEQLEAEGKGAGDRASFRQGLKEAAPQIDELISGLVDTVRESDNNTYLNAMGDYQGVLPGDDWRDTLTSGVPRLFGSVSNYLEQGFDQGFLKGEGLNVEIKQPSDLKGGFTSTLRSQILNTQASLVNLLQQLLRVPGIGAQSDYELKQIIAQTGELSKSPTKEEFQKRLKSVLTNLRARGIPLNIPSMEQVAGPSDNKMADRLEPEGEAPRVNKVQTVPISPSGEIMAPANTGVSVPGATRNPNGAYTGPAPAGTVMSNGTQTIIKGADGRWYDQKTKKPLPAPRP